MDRPFWKSRPVLVICFLAAIAGFVSPVIAVEYGLWATVLTVVVLIVLPAAILTLWPDRSTDSDERP